MEKKRTKPADIDVMAFNIARPINKESEAQEEPVKEKNPAAVAFGRLGGLTGGKARGESLSAKKRKEIAQKAAQKRWLKQ
ncbi:MAG: hypothetical protein ACHQ0Y_07705 [Thermodesulfovibrionales bacterium]